MGARLRRVAGPVVLCVTSSIVALLAAEVGLRVWLPQRLTVPLQDELQGIPANKPNVRGRYAFPGEYDVSVSTSSQRFRGTREYRQHPAPGVLRIAVLGDSVTFGVGAKDEEAYPAQLEAILRQEQRLNERRLTVEVMNAGVPGTGTGEQVLWYDWWVAQFSPHVVILSVFANDLDDDLIHPFFVRNTKGGVVPRRVEDRASGSAMIRGVRGTLNAVPGYSVVAARSYVVNLFRNAVWVHLRQRRHDMMRTVATADATPGPERIAAGLELLRGELAWLLRQVSSQSVRLVVVFFPDQDAVYDTYDTNDREAPERKQKTFAIVAMLRSACAAEGVPFLDLTSLLEHRARVDTKPLYYKVDGHPTPQGYRIMAEGVARLLAKQVLERVSVR